MRHIAGILLVPACTTEDEPAPLDHDAPEVALREYECRLADCVKELVYAVAALESCYADPDAGWHADTPEAIVEGCAPGEARCRILVRSQILDSRDAEACASCVEGRAGEAVPPACCFDEAGLEAFLVQEWAADGADLADRIGRDCQLSAEVALECEFGGLPLGLGDPCP